MSSFMVSAETLGACCDMILNACMFDHIGGVDSDMRREWYHLLIDTGVEDSSWIRPESFRRAGMSFQGLHEALWTLLGSMNLLAVHSRYGDDCGEVVPQHPGSHHAFVDTRPLAIARVKAAHCLIYQCSEGHVPESPLFKLFERTVLAECERLIMATPEYEESRWG